MAQLRELFANPVTIVDPLDICGAEVSLEELLAADASEQRHQALKAELLAKAGIKQSYLILYVGRGWEEEVKGDISWIAAAMPDGELQYQWHDDIEGGMYADHESCLVTLLSPDSLPGAYQGELGQSLALSAIPYLPDTLVRNTFSSLVDVLVAADVVVTSIRHMDLGQEHTGYVRYFPASLLLERPTILTLYEDSESAQLIPFNTAVFVSSEERMCYVLNNILGDHVHHVPGTQMKFKTGTEMQRRLRQKLSVQLRGEQAIHDAERTARKNWVSAHLAKLDRILQEHYGAERPLELDDETWQSQAKFFDGKRAALLDLIKAL